MDPARVQRLHSEPAVKPYLDGNKNNAHDAAAICEASSRPSMRWVEPKTIAQQDLQSLHRVRQVTVRQCTLLANQFNVNGRRRTGLTLVGTVGNKTEYALRSALVTIGSDPSNELVIDESAVSRRHAQVVRRRGIFEIRDLGSTNGTFVNGRRIEGLTRIQTGDEIRFGGVRFSVRGKSSAQPVKRRSARSHHCRAAPNADCGVV